MKKFVGVALAAVLSVSAFASLTQANGKVFVNGEEIKPTYIENEAGEKFIPLRSVCENLGFEVNWIEEERKIEIVKMPIYITCTPDADGYTFSRMAPQPLGKAPMLVEGTTYVPTNFVEAILGGTLADGEDISINYGAPTATVSVIEAKENQITAFDDERGEIVIMVDEETLIFDAEGNEIAFSELDTKKKLEIMYDDAMTMSLPPITKAIKITETSEAAEAVKDELNEAAKVETEENTEESTEAETEENTEETDEK